MGVRYTNGPIEYSDSIVSSNASDLISGIDSVLSPCVLAKATVTGGFKYTLQSPDGLQMKLWIQDLGDHNTDGQAFVRVTPTSSDESQTGQLALLIYDGRTYEAWANCCQFFIAEFGSAGIATSFVDFACGIPALAANTSGGCSAGGAEPTVTQLWWTSSSGTGAFATNWRNSRYCLGNYTLNYNGNLYIAAGDRDPQSLSLLPLCSAWNVDAGYQSAARTQRYTTLDGLRVDAFLAQGQQVYGQLWDAHLYTLPATLDSIVDLTDVDSDGNTVASTWLCWNANIPSAPDGGGGTVLATLFLLLGSFTNSFANVAY